MSERDLDELAYEDEQEELGDDDGQPLYRFDDPAGEDTKDEVFLTKMWGSSAQLEFPMGAPSTSVTQQLVDVRFPEPVVCTIQFQARITSGIPVGLPTTTLELILGLGRVTIERSLSYVAQPTPGADLDVVLELIPSISVIARTTAVATSAGPGSMIMTNSVQVAPVTRINYRADPKRWGMALPGEADSLDDDMLEDLEPNAPSVSQILTAEQPPPIDPQRKALIDRTIAQLTQRLGRRPNKPELKAALARMEARASRRNRVHDVQRAPALPRPAQASPARRAFIEQVIGILHTQLGRKPSKDELRAALAELEVPR